MPDFMLSETLCVTSSPKLTALVNQLNENDPDALINYWEQIAVEGTPLIELIEGDADECIVTFLWRAAEELQQVLLIIDTLTDQYRRSDLTPCFMQHLEGTNLWHLSYRMRNDLRATYHFYPVTPQQTLLSTGAKTREEWIEVITHTLPDPFNPKTFPNRRSGESLSVLELPQAPTQSWWEVRANVAKGILTEHCLQSELLSNQRNIWVYQPADYAPDNTAYPLLVMLDGQIWVQSVSIQTTLDNLIAAGEIPPLIMVAIDSLDGDTRGYELTCNPLFIQYLTDELLPWLEQRWSITSDPARTLITGQSYGGLAAAFAGFHAPQRFGNVLSQSGSFWWKEDDITSEDNEWLVRQYALGEKRPLRFYITVGWQEWMLLAPNRHLRDVLTAKQYAVIYSEYNGGHDYICWRGNVADGLIALAQSWNQPANSRLTNDICEIQVTPRSTIPPQKPKPSAPEVVESPRIQALKSALENDDRAALDDFWMRAAGEGTPLIEPIEGDDDHSIVTFIWRGGTELQTVVILANKFTDASIFDASIMEQLADSDVWYRSYRIRSDWRASYKLAPILISDADHSLGAYASRLVQRAIAVGSRVPRNILEQWWGAVEQAVTDPLNKNRFQDYSVVELPHAPVQHWLNPHHDVPVGSMTEHVVQSKILGNERRVWVYTPANYSSENPPYHVMLLLDGQSWINDNPIATTLDNLIAAGEIPPYVVIMPEALDFETRVREMACYLPFVEFTVDELLPWASTHWKITNAPSQTIIGGQSLGGLTAAFTGLLAPQRFGNVLSQSGSFWWANGSDFNVDGEWLAQQYAQLPKRPLRFYMEVGLQEWVLLSPTRHLRNVLAAKGYDVTYTEFNGGHDPTCFRGSIADGIRALSSPASSEGFRQEI